MIQIPLCDLKEQYKNIKSEILSIVDTICSESSFINGSHVEKFEQDFIKAHNGLYGVGCSNGTSALSLSLEALDVKKGDEVILPSHTFMATAEAICHVGAIPVFCDIKESDYTIDTKKITGLITKKTKAIIPVHIYGTPCDMIDIMQIANNHNLIVVEDSAQAHFATLDGQLVGTFGDAGTFSFYPGKNLGAYGDAGFILCKNIQTEEKLKRLINHGRLKKFDHDIIGYNQRIDAIQAGILSVKMQYIFEWTKKRREIAALYDAAFKPLGFKVVEMDHNKSSSYHVYNIAVSNRSEVQLSLKEQGIQTGIHYPKPVHLMPAFSFLNPVHLPVTEGVSSKILSLPIYPEMNLEQVNHVIESFKKYAQ